MRLSGRELLLAFAAGVPLAAGGFLIVSVNGTLRADPAEVMRLARERRFNEASELGKSCLANRPEDVGLRLLLAQIELDRDPPRPGRALELLENAPTSPRRFAATWLFQRGRARLLLASHDLADADWNAALKLDPLVPEAAWALLDLYDLQGRRREERALALRCHEIEPNSADRVRYLVTLAERDNTPIDPASLIPIFRPLAEAHPEYVPDGVALASALVRDAHYDEGVDRAKLVLAANRESPEAWDGLLGVLDDAGRFGELASTVETLPPSLADDPRFYRHRGRAAQERGDFTAAARAYEAALDDDPSDPVVIYRLSRILRRLGRNVDASKLETMTKDRPKLLESLKSLVKESTRAAELSASRRVDLYNRFAELRDRLGRPDEARAWRRLAAESEPMPRPAP